MSYRPELTEREYRWLLHMHPWSDVTASQVIEKYAAVAAQRDRSLAVLQRIAEQSCEMAFVLEELGRREKNCREAYRQDAWCASCIAADALATEDAKEAE